MSLTKYKNNTRTKYKKNTRTKSNKFKKTKTTKYKKNKSKNYDYRPHDNFLVKFRTIFASMIFSFIFFTTFLLFGAIAYATIK